MVDKPSERRELGVAIAMASLGFELLIPILLGWMIDFYFGWAPVGILVGAALGMAAVLVHAIRLGNLDNKSTKQNQDSETGSTP